MANITTTTTAPNTALKHLNNALGALSKIGLSAPPSDNAPVLAIINSVKDLSEDKAIIIARTLQYQSHFAQVVRDEISTMHISDRHEQIAAMFNSIREDGKRMVKQMDDGKVTFPEKIQNGWMKITRGEIPARFHKIQSKYVEVMRDSNDQIQREDVILNSYQEFRIALKESEIAAQEMFKLAQARLDAKQAVVKEKQDIVDAYTGEDAAEKSRLELARDEAIRELQQEDSRYQKVKNLADNLTVSYAATETVMARLDQTHQIKTKLYDQGVTFFSTAESVLTGLSATLTSLHGLHETAQSVEALKSGINQGIEDLAEMGSAVQTRALKTATGSTIQAQSVKKLVDSIIDFQTKSVEIIREQRALATQNAKEISAVVEDGQRRYAALITQQGVQ